MRTALLALCCALAACADAAGTDSTQTSAGGNAPGGAGGKSGSAGKAGAGGKATSGAGGSDNAGQGGEAQAGAGGSAQAGSGGSSQAGSGGSSQAGSGGEGPSGAGGGGQGGGGSAGKGGSAQASGSGGGSDAEVSLADDLELTELALFQAVKVPLAKGDGEVSPRNAPVVAGKEALVRAYVKPSAGFVPRKVRAELVVEAPGSPAQVLADERQISGTSDESKSATVFTFSLDASLVTPATKLAARLLDPAHEPVGPGTPSTARFPRAGGSLPLGAELTGGPLKITLVPMRYDTDGSGRLPDTSPAQLDRFKALLDALYPVTTIELTVREPVPWNYSLTFGTNNVKFGTLNSVLVDLRASDKAPDDAYYYALISPASSFDAYCGGSCVTGQSFVAEDPADADSRVGSGMGFSGEDSAWTLAHELGHEHGRSHDGCDVSNLDPDYPYDGGLIGVWGRDRRNDAFFDPEQVGDLLGYCDPIWISDYTYKALFERVQAVNKAASQPFALAAYATLDEQPDGSLSWGPTLRRRAAPRGERVEARWLDAAGRSLGSVEAVRRPLSHGGAAWTAPLPPAGARSLATARGLVPLRLAAAVCRRGCRFSPWRSPPILRAMAGRLKVGVMGAGAIGCWVGGRLLAAGSDVVLAGRPRVQAELAGRDLVLGDMGGGEIVVPRERVVYATDPARLADRDVVLVGVKSAHSDEAGRQLAPLLAPGTVVVSLQNGVRNADTLRAAMPAQQVLGGIVGFNVLSQGGGVFRRATTGLLVVEASDDPRARRLAEAMEQAGLDVEVTRDIRGMQWGKLLMNLNNAVSALTDAPTRDLVFEARYRRILAALIGEALDVMRAAGVRPARLGPIPPGLFPRLLSLPTPVLRVVARAQLSIDPEARSSMWEDLSRRRPTEVDFLNGEIVRLAEHHGTRAPRNQRIVELIHEAEQQGQGSPALSAEQLWGEIAGAPRAA